MEEFHCTRDSIEIRIAPPDRISPAKRRYQGAYDRIVRRILIKLAIRILTPDLEQIGNTSPQIHLADADI